jgi:type 1 fimbriae regulatory protein FimB/type 1 fimbriae regulatory protein FimE
MLRHGCGFKLAADGQDTRAIQAYLDHRSIQSTVRYTALAARQVQELLEGLV